jgi:dolichol-phosphate mannosyltransferase
MMDDKSRPFECVLVMPAYNEEGCIRAVVTDWLETFESRFGDSFRFVVVNDGSKDKTGQILDDIAKSKTPLIVIHQTNAGHGAALLTAYRRAVELPSSYTFHTDSDAQFKPSDFIRLWEQRSVSPFILGYRKVRYDALARLVITRILRMLLFALYGVWIPDSNVPYRLINTRYLASLLKVLPPTVFAPNIFLSVLAAKDGQSLLSIPITHQERTTGTVSILRWKLIKVCLRSARELLLFRWTLKNNIRQIQRSSNQGIACST